MTKLLFLDAYKEALALGNQKIIEFLRSTEMLKCSRYFYYEAWKYSARHVQIDLIDYLVNVVLEGHLREIDGSEPSFEEKRRVLREGMTIAFTGSRGLMYKDLLIESAQKLFNEAGIYINFFQFPTSIF